MSETDALVVFLPAGKRGRFPLGTPLLQAARELGVDIDSVCGGRGICGRCQITQAVGEYKAKATLPPADPDREARQIARLRKLSEDADLDPEFSEKFLRFIIEEVIRHHERAAAG